MVRNFNKTLPLQIGFTDAKLVVAVGANIEFAFIGLSYQTPPDWICETGGVWSQLVLKS